MKIYLSTRFEKLQKCFARDPNAAFWQFLVYKAGPKRSRMTCQSHDLPGFLLEQKVNPPMRDTMQNTYIRKTYKFSRKEET